MKSSHAVISIAPPLFELHFENLGDKFAFVLSDLRQTCPGLRWDRHTKVWRGNIADFVKALQCCLRHFRNDQIIIRWGQCNIDNPPRQLALW